MWPSPRRRGESVPRAGLDDVLAKLDAEDAAGLEAAREEAPVRNRAALAARAHAGLEADVLECRVLLEACAAAAKGAAPGAGDVDAAKACGDLVKAFLDLGDAASGAAASSYRSPRGASEDGSRRRRGYDVASSWRRVAAPPRPRRG